MVRHSFSFLFQTHALYLHDTPPIISHRLHSVDKNFYDKFNTFYEKKKPTKKNYRKINKKIIL